jgi:hypothetical protein
LLDDEEINEELLEDFGENDFNTESIEESNEQEIEDIN